jgi:hypothetical protein
MENSGYICVGTFEMFEAKPLLDAFATAGVRVQLSVDDAGLKNDIAAWVGLGGHAVKMIVAVHQDDHGKAYGIMSDLGIY